jgi:hypothetical protein
VAFGKGVLVLAAERGIVAYDASGRPLWKFRPAAMKGEASYWTPFITAKGELVLYDGKKTLHRYRLG